MHAVASQHSAPKHAVRTEAAYRRPFDTVLSDLPRHHCSGHAVNHHSPVQAADRINVHRSQRIPTSPAAIIKPRKASKRFRRSRCSPRAIWVLRDVDIGAVVSPIAVLQLVPARVAFTTRNGLTPHMRGHSARALFYLTNARFELAKTFNGGCVTFARTRCSESRRYRCQMQSDCPRPLPLRYCTNSSIRRRSQGARTSSEALAQ